jgi:branched-chain amino acid transport system permease protein
MSDFYAANLVLIQSTFIGILLALSVQVPMRAGVFSFAGAGSYGIGAYVSAILVLKTGMPSLLAILISGIVAMVVGLLLGLLVAHLGGLYLAMATVSFDLIVSVLAINGGDLTGGVTGLFGVLSDVTIFHLIGLAMLGIVGVALTERGRVGRRVDAVRDDPELAQSVGISVRRYRLAAFVVSGLLGSVAGSLNSLVRSTISPSDIGFSLIVLALTMIIVGGAQSWKGAVLGAVIFTWLPPLLAGFGQLQHVVYGVIVATAAIFVPGGLYGIYSEARYRRTRAKRKTPQGEAPAHEQALAISVPNGDAGRSA